jgi:hypothetical protein
MEALLRRYVIYDEDAKKLAAVKDQWPVLDKPRIVYRSHREEPSINTARKRPLFSASTNIRAAIEEFAGPDCCVFKIHLPAGVRYIDVNNMMGADHSKAHEKEIIFESGGDFFTGPDGKLKGVTEIRSVNGRRVFETYYFPEGTYNKNNGKNKTKKNENNANTKGTRKNNSIRNLTKNVIINRFADEYDLYNSENNLPKFNVFMRNIKKQILPTERITKNVEDELREYFASI